ncbi:16S rRNA (guanine(966)-N(2))-methyltransferase RsmD [Konateibacter massiliensis]|uniref:16S rRNA (guanine(966)-N(2))-methyltransferase RsmD n=1 Tax=Konateibacter massiliensis TaxID=2002841 RepID=UPI001F36BD5C|nr:16S rRNA (guanine(966)-N(2))-methyltransferase RsmD [Konateibacter massiliensis]
MRVIAGTARRHNLQTVSGDATRPTSDRIKETLFNMLNPYLEGATFLDLFAGSGQIGIEALSRGAKEAVFVENGREAVSVIEYNLEHTKLKSNAQLIPSDVLTALRRLEGKYVFDYIFMDPPYNQLLEKQVLEYLKSSSLIDKTSVIIVEASLETRFDYAEDLGFRIVQRKEYKTSMHIFLEMQ